jgi:hypothetical protein
MYTSALSATLLLASLAVTAQPLPKPSDISQRIDAAFQADWKKQNVTPDASVDDAAFLRRVWLDLAGTLPPPLAARDYLASTQSDRRVQVIDTLLAGDEFADHWSRVWTAHLTGKRAIKQEKYDGRRLQEYLRDSFAANKSYGQIVTDLICGEGLSESSGPANFLLRYEAKPSDLAGAVARSFLGTSLQCAQCHNHPFENWKKDDFWGVAAFFSRVRMLEFSADNEYLTSLQETRRGELEVPDPDAKPAEDGTQPKKKIKPRLPGAAPLPPQSKRREALAKWVTSSDNPYFARHAVNQVWVQLLGRPLGKIRNKDVADDDDAPREVWQLLTEDFKASGYDFKRLVQTIVLSKTYQLGAGGANTAAGDTGAEKHHQVLAHFARYPTRALSVDQVYRSIVQATGHTGDPEPEPAKSDADKSGADEESPEADADRPVEVLTERSQTVQRALALLHGDFANQAVHAGAKLTLKINGPKPGADHIDWIFLATLSRHPTKEENAAMIKLLEANKGAGGVEDVWWVILNSAEFHTNH